MNKNVKIAKELIKLAKSLIAKLKIKKQKFFVYDSKGESIELSVFGEVNNISEYSTEEINQGIKQFYLEANIEINKVNGKSHGKPYTYQNDFNIYYLLEGDITPVKENDYEYVADELRKNGWIEIGLKDLRNKIDKFF